LFIINKFSALFFKKGILFYFFVSSVLQKSRRQALEKDYHTRPRLSSKIGPTQNSWPEFGPGRATRLPQEYIPSSAEKIKDVVGWGV
jgi:hypothetical protein